MPDFRVIHLAIVDRQIRRDRLSTPESCKALSKVNFLSEEKEWILFSSFSFVEGIVKRQFSLEERSLEGQ